MTPPPAAGVAQPVAVPRKIIYRADVVVTVDDFGRAEASIATLVDEFHGYFAESSLSGSPGGHRTGRWVVRVPVESYERFADAAARLGELQSRGLNSQDVTEEFYDLDARIKNKKVEEARLLKHLESSTGNLKDILEVERELSRVREEVERIQGRLQLLANLTSLTTVTISVYERLAYVPPESPAFAARASRRFSGSVTSLMNLAKNFALDAISVVPWLPVWAVVLGVGWWAARRVARSRRRRPEEPRPA